MRKSRTATTIVLLAGLGLVGLHAEQSLTSVPPTSQPQTRPAISQRSPADDAWAPTWLRPGLQLKWVARIAFCDPYTFRWQSQLPQPYISRECNTGHPMEYYLSLGLRTPQGLKAIGYPSDLTGFVSIHNQHEALKFVHLFSSANVNYRFPQYPYVELTIVDRSDPGPAEISRQDAATLGLIPAEALEFDGAFRLLRPVVLLQRDTEQRFVRGRVAYVAMLDERIGPDGSYRVMEIWRRPVPKGMSIEPPVGPCGV